MDMVVYILLLVHKNTWISFDTHMAQKVQEHYRGVRTSVPAFLLNAPRFAFSSFFFLGEFLPNFTNAKKKYLTTTCTLMCFEYKMSVMMQSHKVLNQYVMVQQNH